MGRKDLRFNFETNDLDFGNGELAFIEGPELVLQEISLELKTVLGSMPHAPEYGSWIAGALNSRNVDKEDIRQEVERIANKHPDVESYKFWFDGDVAFLRVKLYESEGGGVGEGAVN